MIFVNNFKQEKSNLANNAKCKANFPKPFPTESNSETKIVFVKILL